MTQLVFATDVHRLGGFFPGSSLWDLAATRFGGVDIWINNAGLARTLWPILDVPQSDVETMLRTNMLGTINGCRVALDGMRAAGQGKLFNMLGGGSDGEYFPGMIITEAVVREAREDLESFEKSRKTLNN